MSTRQAKSPSEPVSVLGKLSRDSEEATDMYALACDAAAEAENNAERAYYVAFAKSQAESVAAREHEAKQASLNERAVARIKAASEKAARQRVVTLLARLSAAQSHQRVVERQT